MQDSWLNASNAAHYLGKLTKRSFTVSNLKKICATGHCDAYINCRGAEGVENGTSRKVCATDIQVIVHPEHMKRSTFEYWGEAPQEILTVTQPIIVRGPVLVCSYEGKAAYPENSITWKLTKKGVNYPATFRLSDIEALANKIDLIEDLLKDGDDIPLKMLSTFDIETVPINTDSIKEIQLQLEQERIARKAAEQRANSAGSEAKPSHLLAIAGLLELLLESPLVS